MKLGTMLSTNLSLDLAIAAAYCPSGGVQFSCQFVPNVTGVGNFAFSAQMTVEDSGTNILLTYDISGTAHNNSAGSSNVDAIVSYTSSFTPSVSTLPGPNSDDLGGVIPAYETVVAHGTAGILIASPVAFMVMPKNIRFRLTSTSARLGSPTVRGRVACRPDANLSLTNNDPDVSVDGSTSVPCARYDTGFPVAVTDAATSITYAWEWGDGDTATGATATHTYVDDGSYLLQLTVTDNYGGSDLEQQFVTIADAATPLGSFTDETGALFSAVKSGTTVQTKTFASGSTTATNRASVSNAKSPDYKKALRGIRQYLLVHDRTSGDAVLRTSDDNGRTVS